MPFIKQKARGERRLAAILAADVVGYSRLIGQDERGTLSRLKSHRGELIEPLTRKRRGRIVKTTGDGILIEFPSAVEAVECAVEVQRGMLKRNANVPPDRRIVFRIGVHQGDVVFEDGDVFGDGVNIAARLEAVAEPGGICVSARVHEDLLGKLDLDFTDRGEQQIKNISRPVRVYALGPAMLGNSPAKPMHAGPVPARRRRDGRRIAAAAGVLAAAGLGVGLLWLMPAPPLPAPIQPGEPAITAPAGPEASTTTDTQAPQAAQPADAPRLSFVVLPFANLTNDPDQEHFAEGLTADITADLSHLADSFVIARDTAFAYKGTAIDAKQLGRDLGVRYVVEGSVARRGNQARISAQLLSTETGAQVWADRVEGDLGRLGELQIELVARLARGLDARIPNVETLRALRDRASDPDAVDLALRGWAALDRPPSEDNAVDAVGRFERALQLDPQLPQGLIGMARALLVLVANGWSANPAQDTARADELITRVLTIEPGHASARLVKADVLKTRRQFDQAISELKVAIGHDRNLASGHASAGATSILTGRSAEAVPLLETAIRLSPRDPLLNVWEFQICHAYAHLAQWDKAIAWCNKSIATNADYWLPYADLAAAYAWTGRDAEARAAVAELLKLMPGYTVRKWLDASASDNSTFRGEYQRIVDGLRKAGLPEG
jgi:class 3 adenylate cyclase/TolB-like protein/Flp pilus assembly protein TadD